MESESVNTPERTVESEAVSATSIESLPAEVPPKVDEVDDKTQASAAENVEHEARTGGVQEIASGGNSASGGSFCCSFVANMDPRARELIYWKNPVQTGVFFGVTLVTLIVMCCNGFINTLAFAGLVVLSLSFAVTAVSSVAKRFLGKEISNPLRKFFDQPIEISDERIDEISQCCASMLEKSCQELRRLYCIVDIPDSFKFGVGLWLVYWITSRVGFFDLLIIAEVLIFSVPKVYELYQAPIDQAVEKGKVQIAQLLEKAKTMPYVEQIAKVLSPKEKTN